jgi:hypothetical protein
MNLVDIGQVIQSLILFSSATRLFELRIGDAQSTDLLVEAFTAEDAIQELGARTVIALSTNAFIPLTSLLNEPASLLICLPDGPRSTFSGFITEASLLSCDGGFARFCLRIAPWMWKLEQIRNCRVWENKTVVQIIDEVFWPYQPDARWRWTSETYRYMEKAVERSYCCQYRESDFDFIRRLLTEEGLCWRFGGSVKTGAGIDKFTTDTESAIRNFQRDYMHVPDTGKICGDVLTALDQFRIRFPVSIEEMKCRCGTCGGFGQSLMNSETVNIYGGRGEIIKGVEFPGIHRGLAWLFRAAQFRRQ